MYLCLMHEKIIQLQVCPLLAAAAADVHVDEDVDIVLLSVDASARSIPSIDIGRIASHRTASRPPRALNAFPLFGATR